MPSPCYASGSEPDRHDCSSQLFSAFDQFSELLEKIIRVVRAGCSFGMILHTEDRKLFVSHSFHGSIVEIDVCHFDVFWQRLGIDRKPVVLRGNCHFSRPQILDWLVTAAMPKLEFEGPAAKGKTEYLMTKADAEDGFAFH